MASSEGLLDYGKKASSLSSTLGGLLRERLVTSPSVRDLVFHTLLVASTESIDVIWPIRNILIELSLRSTASGCCSSKLNGRRISS